MKKISAFILAIAMILAMMVSASAAVKVPETPDGGIGPVGTWHITGDGVYFRTGPGTNYPAIGQLFKGDYCDRLGVDGDWYHLRITSGANCGKTGYAPSRYVAPGYF